jgi:hypothetical protein
MFLWGIDGQIWAVLWASTERNYVTSITMSSRLFLRYLPKKTQLVTFFHAHGDQEQ